MMPHKNSYASIKKEEAHVDVEKSLEIVHGTLDDIQEQLLREGEPRLRELGEKAFEALKLVDEIVDHLNPERGHYKPPNKDVEPYNTKGWQ